MSLKKINYNFHDLVEIEVHQDDVDLNTNFSCYFRSFLANSPTKTKSKYKLYPYSHFIEPKHYYNVSNLYYGFDRGVYFPQERYALLKYDNVIEEYCDIPNRGTNMLLQLLLIEQDISLLHCGAFQFQNKGILLPAFGGAGKTSIIARLRKHDSFKLLGDDFVAISEKGEIHSYHADLSVYDYHLDLFPELKNTKYGQYLDDYNKIMSASVEAKKNKKHIYELTPKSLKKIIPFKNQIKKLISTIVTPPPQPIQLKTELTNWNHDYIKVPVNKVFSNNQLTTHAPIDFIMYLSRYSGETFNIVEISPGELANECVGVLATEFRYCLIYLEMLSAFGLYDFQEFFSKIHVTFMKAFTNKKMKRLLIPFNATPDEVAKFVENYFVNTSEVN